MTPLRTVINDMYAKDISKKVRTTLEIMRQDGKYIGFFGPYGYKKDPSDKSKVVIDLEAAFVVKKVFKLYLEGNRYNKISKY